MLKQKLRILVLRHLAEQPRSGYRLIKDIEKHTGWRPSYGSIYPVLDHLHEDNLATFKQIGRRKVYSLTAKGKEELEKLKLDNEEAMETIDQLHRLVMGVCGIKNPDLPVADMMRRFINPDPEMKRIMKKSYELKLEFARLMEGEGYKKNVDLICTMLDAMTQKLKRMK